MKVWMTKDFREKFFTDVSTLPLQDQSMIINEVYRDKEVRAVKIKDGNILVELRGGTSTYLLPRTEKFMRIFIGKHYPEVFL